MEEKKINQMSLTNCDLDEVEIVLGDRFELKIVDGKYYAVRKKPKYPTTYEECCEMLNTINSGNSCIALSYLGRPIFSLAKLIIMRDAYWKLAGEQMGLGKPWEPDWNESKPKYTIAVIENKLVKYYEYSKTNKHNIKLGIRPEDIVRLEDRTAKHNLGKSFISSVIVPELLGHEYYVHFNLGDHELISKIQGNDNIQIGDKLELAFNMDFLHLFDDVSTKLIK